jgi:hypothetical protein
VSALVATGVLDPATPAAFAASLGAVVAATGAAGVTAYRFAGRSLRRLVVTPFGLAAITWLVLLVGRPLDLYVWPGHGAGGLTQLGFGLADLTRAVAIGGLGCAAWYAGYLVLARPPTPRVAVRRPLPVSGRGAASVLALGTLLWALLFVRQGGPSAILQAPASIRVNQGASFYAFVGVWMIQGVALYAFASLLAGGGRVAKRVLWASVVLALLAALALQLRGLVAVAVIGALAIYVTVRRVSRRQAVVGLAVLILGVLAFGAAQQVRQYGSSMPTADAIRLTARTPVHLMYMSDLSTFDNLVALRQIVPESLDYLDGETLLAIPQAVVPRAVWPDKPVSIDLRVGGLLYPGSGVGIPITMQGELFWNGGLVAVFIGALLIGLAFGALARAGLGSRLGPALVLYAAVFPFTHAALTRSLASAAQNIVFVLLGVGIAIAALDPAATRTLVRRLSEAVPVALPRLRGAPRRGRVV